MNCCPEEHQGEKDYPDNCETCGEPLKYSLTSEGVEYVLEAIRESLAQSEEERNAIIPVTEHITYYCGSRRVEVVRDWAEDLSWYNLSLAEETLINTFLEITAPKKQEMPCPNTDGS